MSTETATRYEVVQLGPADSGVLDTATEDWVFDGNHAACEDHAARLNADGGQS